MKTNDYNILDWDSAFFGFRVARIVPDNLNLKLLSGILDRMKRDNVALAYWASDPNDAISQEAARSCRGFLADRKVTFAIDARAMRERPAVDGSLAPTEEYMDDHPDNELEALALQAGMYSRYKVDPSMPENRFADLYRLWITRSVKKEIADAVLVARKEGRIVGMVTVGKTGNCAVIGLIAVDSSMRGCNIGTSLTMAALEWALKAGCDTVRVITQGENMAACRLYEKCGFVAEKVEHIYHFWI